MSEYLPAPTFSAAYTTPLTDIGSGYARGIETAGKALSEAIGSVSDIATKNVDANDTLTALKATGILKPEEYEAVMGKSLGAKQQMVGLYAGQWIADQAARRAQALQMGKSTADITTEHAKLLDTIDAVKKGYGAAAGVNVGKLPINQAQNQQVPTAQPVQKAQPVTPAEKLAGVPGQPTPLGSGDIYNPLQAGVIIGVPLAGKDPIPPGSKTATLRGQRGYIMADGRTFRPMQ